MDLKKFGEQLKTLRRQAQLSQKEFVDALDQLAQAGPSEDYRVIDGPLVSIRKFSRKPISLEKKADVKARLDRLRQQSVRGAGTKLPVPRPGLKFNKKDIRQQMAKRGWTEQLVRATRDNPVKVVETRDIRRVKGLPGRRYEPATAYYSARGGYIVVNNRTGEVVQVSDRTKPDWKTRLFRPRSDPR